MPMSLRKTDSKIAHGGRAKRTLAVEILLALLLSPVIMSQSARAATSENSQSPLGINLSAVNFYASEMPFINDFLSVSQWITHEEGGAWDTNEEKYLQLDANGWPTTLAGTNEPSPQKFNSIGALFFRDLPRTPSGYYPAGKYIVLYDGQGKISYGLDARLASSSPGRDVLEVTPSTAGIDLRILATDPHHKGDYIRNIRVVSAQNEAGYKAGQVFDPVFVSRIQRFRTLRFMDWLQTNGNTLTTWSARPVPANAFWGTSAGVPIEATVQLANAVSADAWLNVPHMADDNFISQMAALLHASLGKTQKVYVEFSNEVWNGSFPQYQYAVSRGQALWGGRPGSSGYDWNRNWYGMRTGQMCDIWKSVWGSDANRVVCVLGAQAAVVDTAMASLTCKLWTQGSPCLRHGIDAVAIAPYFAYEGVPALWIARPDGGLAGLFDSLTSQNDSSVPTGGALGMVSMWEKSYVAALAQYKLPLIAYEGGQGFANGASVAITNLYIAANRDARMEPAYTAYLNQWRTNGGQLFVHFNDIGPASKYGEWGALESLMQAVVPLAGAPPKWRALQNFVTANPCWWPDCSATIDLHR